MTKVRVAIIGAGRIADIHAESYYRLGDQADVVAVVDTSLENARCKAQLWGAQHAYDSIDALLTDCDVDAVDICLPHHLHLEAVRKACAKGKHILLEKPIARSIAEADEIIDIVKATGVRFMVAHNHIFNPIIRKAKEILEKGLIGRVHLVKAFSLGWFRFQEDDFRMSYEKTGGGVLIDTGVHFIYILLHLFGDVESVTALQGRLVRKEMGGEDTAILALKFVDDLLGEITVSYASKVPNWEKGFPAGWEQGIYVLGTDGALSLSLTDNKLKYCSDVEMPSTLNPSSGWTEVTIENAYVLSFYLEVAHFVESVASDTAPKVGGEEGRKALEIIVGAYRSVSEGQTIFFGEKQ